MDAGAPSCHPLWQSPRLACRWPSPACVPRGCLAVCSGGRHWPLQAMWPFTPRMLQPRESTWTGFCVTRVWRARWLSARGSLRPASTKPRAHLRVIAATALGGATATSREAASLSQRSPSSCSSWCSWHGLAVLCPQLPQGTPLPPTRRRLVSAPPELGWSGASSLRPCLSVKPHVPFRCGLGTYAPFLGTHVPSLGTHVPSLGRLH